MEFRIEERNEFRVVGHATGGDWTLENASKKATELWTYLGENGAKRIHDALSLMDGSEPHALLGVSFCDDGEFKGYLVGVATGASCPEGMEERVVPAATYAVYDCTGPMSDAMQRLQHRIHAEWPPSSGYEWASKSDVEVYFGPNMTADDYRSQVWLPIEKR